MFHRKIKFFVICLLLIYILTGCYDAKELDEMTYVVAIGVDKGVSDNYRLTIKFHTMKGSQGGSGGGGGDGGGGGGGGGTSGGSYETLTIDAPSFFTGINMINAIVARKLNFMHAKMLVFSEDIAKSGVSTYIAPIIRFREIRRAMHVIVSRSSASKFIEAYEPIEGNALAKAMELILTESLEVGFISHVTLSDFYKGLKSTYRQPIAILGGINSMNILEEDGKGKVEDAKKQSTDSVNINKYLAGDIPRKGGGKIEIYGTAVFDGDRMVGELTGEETRMLNILIGEFKKGNITVEDPLSPTVIVPIDVRMQRDPKVEVKKKDGKRNINVLIRLEGDILAVQSRINYEEEPLKTKLEGVLIQMLKDDIYSLIDKCKNWGVDIFGFGKKVSSDFYTIQEWEKFNWVKEFKNSDVNVDIKFVIRRTGTLLKSSPVITTEGTKPIE